jgi:hypothetical protein
VVPGCGPNQPPNQGGQNCAPNQDNINGICVPRCGPNQTRDPDTRRCVDRTLKPLKPLLPVQPNCSSREELVNGVCVLKCRPDQRRVNGVCVSVNNNPPGGGNKPPVLKPAFPNNNILPACGQGEELIGRRCVPRCGNDQMRARNGSCIDRNNNGKNLRMLKIQ